MTLGSISNEEISSELISRDKTAWITKKMVKSNVPLYKTFDDNKHELTIYENVSIFL